MVNVSSDSVIYSPFILYNELQIVPTTKMIVPVRCPKCGNVKQIKLCSHLQTIRKNEGNYLCHKCSIDRGQCQINARKLWNDHNKADAMRKHLQSMEMKRKVRENNARLRADEEWFEKWKKTINLSAISRASKEMWQKPDFRERIKKSFSERCKKQWQNPSYRAKIEAFRATEAYRTKMDALRKSDSFLQKMKQLWSDGKYREKMSKAAHKIWSDPAFREKMARVRLEQPKTSSQQLYSILSDLNVKFEDDTSIASKVGFYTFDCRIDPQSGIKLTKPLLIEVKGDYWHSLPKAISKDRSKATYLKTYFPEFDLRYLWEHEFIAKDRIIGLLKYWLGLTDNTLVNFNFKEVTMRIIEAKEAELFISKYHYAGRVGRSGVNLGYFVNGQLVACIIYAYPIRQEVALKQGLSYKSTLELSRFCIHPNYQVKNFASFLIADSIRYIKANRSEIKLLISFSDSTYNHQGTIYKASNWSLDGEVAPDYWYADDCGYICHKKTLWNKAKKMGMAESQYCEKYHYAKICGNKKYRYIYKL